jgi:hypothetical protein
MQLGETAEDLQVAAPALGRAVGPLAVLPPV